MKFDCDETPEQEHVRTVFVSNLAPSVTVGDLYRHLAAATRLRPQQTFLERGTNGEPAGYAFLMMRTEEEAIRLVARGLPPLLRRTTYVARRQPRSRGGRLMDYFLLLLDGQAQARSFPQGQGGTLPVV